MIDDGRFQQSDWLLQQYNEGRRDFRRVILPRLQLHGGYFHDCDFREASFQEAIIDGAHFHGCNFENAELWQSWITRTEFTNCNLEHASFVGSLLTKGTVVRCSVARLDALGSTLDELDVRSCDFTSASLHFAVFRSVKLVECQFHFASLDNAVFVNTPLDDICASADVSVKGLAADWSSIALSVRATHLSRILTEAGMPDIFVVYSLDCARAQDPTGLFRLMRSTFISYGGPDIEFARMFQEALQRAGVRTFFFAKDAVPGQKLHSVMRDGVTRYDRVLLICSRASLDRPGVLNEIEQTLTREARDGGESYLIPITLDDYVFEWAPSRLELADEVRSRVVADFRGAATNPTVFADAMKRLIRALRTTST